MFVTQHARSRLAARLGTGPAASIAAVLETYDGERGVVAYILADLHPPVQADDGSNGDLLVVVVDDGSVGTVYFRRSEQDTTPAYFGAHKVVDLRVYPLTREGA